MRTTWKTNNRSASSKNILFLTVIFTDFNLRNEKATPPKKKEEEKKREKNYNPAYSIPVISQSVHMVGIALMVISPKNWEFLPIFMSTLWIIQPHLKSFNYFI